MISEELLRIQEAKNNIKSSVKAKGVEIPPTALISDYPGYIDQIPQGGPTPPPAPEPVRMEPYYVDGWWEHQEGNWAFVKANSTLSIDYKLTSSSSTQNWSHATGTLDEWVNLDDVEWRTAEKVVLTSGNNPILALNVDMPNYVDSTNLYNTYFIYSGSNIRNLKIKLNTISYLPNVFSNNIGMVTCEIYLYHPESIGGTNSSMSQMFSGCSNLQSLDLSGWNVENVTSMQQMFYQCTALQSLKLSGWNPRSVTNMQQMFYQCYSLHTLDLSGWNTENVTNMVNMFNNCYSLHTLDLSGWNVENVTNMGSMFTNCHSLQSLDLSGWNVVKVTNIDNIFTQCSSLQSLDLSGWNVENVKNMYQMFYQCYALQSLDLSGWNPRSATNMQQMFASCSSLVSLDLSGWNVESVTTMQQMFSACYSLQSLDLSGWNPRSVTSFSAFLYFCGSLHTLDLSGWNVENVTNVNQMVYLCHSLKSLNLSGWNPRSVTNFSNFFKQCESLRSLDITGWTWSDNITTNWSNIGFTEYAFSNLKADTLPMQQQLTIGLNCILTNESLQYLAEHLPTPRTYEKTVYNITDFDIDLNGQWVESTYTNPDGDTYDMYMSDSNYHVSSGIAVMSITIRGNGHFEFYINSYGEPGYDFTRVYKLDSTSSILLDTNNFSKDPSGPIDTNYRKVEFDIEDGGTHTIRIDYKKDGSGNNNYDRGFILVKKAELIPPVETVTVVDTPMKISLRDTQLNETNNPWINILKEKNYIR